jgi:site-specific DNA-methyltransferase (adenine-specific)
MTDKLAPITLDRIELYRGDSRDVLPLLEPEQFTACVCDPPYHLTQASRKGSPRNNDPETPFGRTRLGSKGFMGKTWDGGDVAFRPEFWIEVLRVLKPGAMLLAFGGTRTFHRLTCAIEDAGFEIRDCLMWLCGSGFPKSLDISKALDKAAGVERNVIGRRKHPTLRDANKLEEQANAAHGGNVWSREWDITAPATGSARMWAGYGTALKPAYEPIVLAMRPLDGTFAENVHRYGVAGLNIDGARIGVGKGGRRDGEKTAEKRYADRGATNFAPMPGPRGGDAKGRWPANLLLEEQAGEMLDRQSGITKSGAMKRQVSPYPGENATGFLRGHSGPHNQHGDSGGASRFFFCSKASKRDRTCDGRVENNHPTVKPRSLMEYLCRLVTPPGGGVILDPFMGSGSTGIGALDTGNRFVGIELEPESFETARRRIEAVSQTISGSEPANA